MRIALKTMILTVCTKWAESFNIMRSLCEPHNYIALHTIQGHKYTTLFFWLWSNEKYARQSESKRTVNVKKRVKQFLAAEIFNSRRNRFDIIENGHQLNKPNA
jgi:hypothetical protein